MGTADRGEWLEAQTFNDWMIDKTGARWQFWFALGFSLGLAVTL